MYVHCFCLIDVQYDYFKYTYYIIFIVNSSYVKFWVLIFFFNQTDYFMYKEDVNKTLLMFNMTTLEPKKAFSKT